MKLCVQRFKDFPSALTSLWIGVSKNWSTFTYGAILVDMYIRYQFIVLGHSSLWSTIAKRVMFVLFILYDVLNGIDK